MLQEFKKFAMQGNVIDLAVGVIIGAAFGKIISSLVNDVLMPLFGVVLGNIDFSGLALGPVKYGMFLQAVIDFLIVAFCIFLAVKQLSRFKKTQEAKPAEPSEEVKLLREIRDCLRK